MMRLAVLTGLLILHGTLSATAAGFAHNASFMVFSPAQPSQEMPSPPGRPRQSRVAWVAKNSCCGISWMDVRYVNSS